MSELLPLELDVLSFSQHRFLYQHFDHVANGVCSYFHDHRLCQAKLCVREVDDTPIFHLHRIYHLHRPHDYFPTTTLLLILIPHCSLPY